MASRAAWTAISESAYRAFVTDILKGLAEAVGREKRVRTLVINWWAYCSDITRKTFGEDGGHERWDETACIQAIDRSLVHPERYKAPQAMARQGAGTWSAFPFLHHSVSGRTGVQLFVK